MDQTGGVDSSGSQPADRHRPFSLSLKLLFLTIGFVMLAEVFIYVPSIANFERYDVESHLHPLLGRDGERLAMDVVRDGPADATRVLIISSACHGVEGYCGSGVQITLLGDAGFRAAAREAGVALLPGGVYSSFPPPKPSGRKD